MFRAKCSFSTSKDTEFTTGVISREAMKIDAVMSGFCGHLDGRFEIEYSFPTEENRAIFVTRMSDFKTITTIVN